jgi:hypothetical protein
MTDHLLREVNRQIYEIVRSFDEPAEYVCECGDVSCRTTFLKADPLVVADVLGCDDLLLVASGHEPPGTALVQQGQGWLVLRRPPEDGGVSGPDRP